MIKFAALSRTDAVNANAGCGEFVIGRDEYDHWIVMETKGRCGGFFASQLDALRYARRESKGRPERVRLVQHALTFSTSEPRLA